MADFLDNFTELDTLIMADLGDDITFMPLSGGSYAIKGEFNESFYLTDAETGIETVAVVVDCLEKDVPNARGGAIVRGGKSYSIKGNPHKHDNGLVLLVLRLYQPGQSEADEVSKVLIDSDGYPVLDADNDLIKTA